MENQEGEQGFWENYKADIRKYVNLKIDDYKLKGVETLSILSNKLIFTILFIVLCGIVLQLLAFALGYLLGEWIGSYAAGFAIAGVVVLLIMLILYFCRDKLFINTCIRVFIKVFFGNDKSK